MKHTLAVLLLVASPCAFAQDTPAVAAPPAPGTDAPAPPKANLVPLTAPKPVLSDAACQQRAVGSVELEFAVLPDGRVADVRVTDAKPRDVFESAAVTAVAARLYPSQAAPVKMRERLLMSYTDCRAEQLRAPATADAGAAAPDATACPALAEEVRARADAIAPAEGARSTTEKAGAQVYTAPAPQCFVAGRKLGYGTRVTASAEHGNYSLVTKGKESFWLLSSQMKDVSQ